MKHRLHYILILCAGLVTGMPAAIAQEAPKFAEKKPANTATKKPIKRKTNPEKTAPVLDEEEAEPDIANSTATDFACELGNKITIYKNLNDDMHIALRWKKRLMRLTKVDTTTGAHRYENRKIGLVWLGIPAKGILLDSKKGQQLANECKNAEQSAVQPETLKDSLPMPSESLVVPPASSS